MRAIECPCGHHLEGGDDEELFRLARAPAPGLISARWVHRGRDVRECPDTTS